MRVDVTFNLLNLRPLLLMVERNIIHKDPCMHAHTECQNLCIYKILFQIKI